MMRSGRRSGARIFCSDSSPQGHVRHKAGNAHSHPQRKAHVEAIARAPGLSAEVSQEFEQICQQMHVELTAQSSHGKRIVAEKSGHLINSDQPELVIDAIREVVEAARCC